MVSGKFQLGFEKRFGTAGEIRAYNPKTNQQIDPVFGLAKPEDAEQAGRLAASAYEIYRETTPENRARFLETIATNLEASAETIIARATTESGLPEARIRGELGRTTGQLRMFAGVLREGSSQGVRIDPAQPERTPAPRSDIRLRLIPVGPVVVFGSSNFPLAFSNAGGDVASALAAGCPVIVKVHNAHPGTAELVTDAIIAAVKEHHLPEGTYSSILGSGNTIGVALVTHPAVKAVGFTGSRSGGLALVKAAQERPEPIPVYAEMSSTNPVFVFESGITEQLAADYVASLTLGSGQYCTNPGNVFVPIGKRGDHFIATVQQEVIKQQGQTMLSAGIYQSFQENLGALAQSGVTKLAEGHADESALAPAPTVFEATSEQFIANPLLSEEIFGAASLIVRYSSIDELLTVVRGLEGQLTVTIHAQSADYDQVQQLLPLVEQKVGRILFNGWPTGVEVGHAMVHSGPYPATSDSRTTSVGSAALYRFLRPVSYQDVPAELLPEALQDENPWQLPRRIEGQIVLP